MSKQFKVTDGQKYALMKMCSNFIKIDSGKLYLISKLLERDINRFSSILYSEWKLIRDEAYPNWSDGVCDICDDFKKKCEKIVDEYEIEVMGQLSIKF